MNKVFEPIFFIGVPRSGTTIIFEAFAKHEQLGWPSNYTEKFPTIPLFGLILRLTNNNLVDLTGQKRQYNKVLIGNRLLPKPAEAYNFWNYYTECNFDREYLVKEVPSFCVKKRVKNAIIDILRWEGKNHFCAKLTGPSRISFLKKLFPDAKFIHIIRDGRAVVHSMLKTHSWTKDDFLKTPWWNGGLDEKDVSVWQSHNKDPAILAALQWKKIIEIAHQESLSCTTDSYLEIKYEDFIETPKEVLHNLFTWCNLRSSDKADDYLKKQKFQNMNVKYKKDMTESKTNLITEIMQPLINQLGYVN